MDPHGFHMHSIWIPCAHHRIPMETTMAIRHIRFRSNTFAFASVQHLIEGRTRDGIPGSPLLLGLERAKANRAIEPPCLKTWVLKVEKIKGLCLLASKSECIHVRAKANVALGALVNRQPPSRTRSWIPTQTKSYQTRAFAQGPTPKAN